ncbi:hypothetical protein [Treponema sp.]|uniref:hypothetical protein n=1 Tax=Treponema sp. TaxID=166 RepID=UPI003F03944C
MNEENELDSTCGISDEELTARFNKAIQIETEISRINGTPITRYDANKKTVYLEYPDGHIEYAKKA